MHLKVDWDEEGKRFRIIVQNEANETVSAGEWALYKGIAKLTFEDVNYLAVSAYHEGPFFQAETIYALGSLEVNQQGHFMVPTTDEDTGPDADIEAHDAET
jgi:hypothetical protein